MANFINDYRNPVFKISGGGLTGTITIALPLTGSDGLQEKIEEIRNSKQHLNYSISDKIYGYRITWTLPYKEYANTDTMLKIQDILLYRKQGYKVELIPRAGQADRIYEVIYTGTELTWGIMKGGRYAIGSKGVVIEWQTKYLVDELGWIDPSVIPHPVFYLYSRLGVKQLS